MKNIDTILCELAKKETQTNSAGVFESADKTKQIGATVAYYMNRRDSFHVFLEDPEVPTDSNAVERAIRPLTVCEKRQISNNPVTERKACAFSCRCMKRPKQTISAIFLRGCWRAVVPTICTAPTER